MLKEKKSKLKTAVENYLNKTKLLRTKLCAARKRIRIKKTNYMYDVWLSKLKA